MKYPNITVKLTGENGNAFLILGKTIRTMKQAKLSQEEINIYRAEATSKGYDRLLATTMQWVNVE